MTINPLTINPFITLRLTINPFKSRNLHTKSTEPNLTYPYLTYLYISWSKMKSDFFHFFADFDVFGPILFLFAPSRPLPPKKRFPTGPPYYRFI